jgi:hypothetical protein
MGGAGSNIFFVWIILNFEKARQIWKTVWRPSQPAKNQISQAQKIITHTTQHDRRFVWGTTTTTTTTTTTGATVGTAVLGQSMGQGERKHD